MVDAKYSIFIVTVLCTEPYMLYSRVCVRVDIQIHHGIGENNTNAKIPYRHK